MLDEYINRLGNSRPIFKLRISGNKSRIDSILVDPYCPKVSNPSDPLDFLVCDNYEEILRNGEYVKNRESIKRSCYEDIKKEFRNFISRYGGYKNPRQSSVHRWLGNYSTPSPAETGLVYLYKYAKSIGMINGSLPSGLNVDEKHKENILSILEMMRVKYEPK